MENVKVLLLCSDSSYRQKLSQRLTEARFQARFVSNIADCNANLADYRPVLLVHDWAAVEPTQARSFVLGFRVVEQNRMIRRIIIAETITPELTALALDAGVDQVVTYANAFLNLGMVVNSVISTPRSEFQQALSDIKLGLKEYSQEELDHTIELAYEKHPGDRTVALEYGGLALRREDLEEPIKIANELLSKNELDVRAMNLLSRAYMQKGDFASASDVLEKANVFSPSNPERLIMLGDAYFGGGDLDKALASYQEAALNKPEGSDDTTAEKKMVTVKVAQGDLDAALEIMTNSLSEEESAALFNNTAVMAARSGKLEEATRLYELALRTLKTPRLRARILFNLALSQRKRGDDNSAFESLRKALKYDPEHANAKKHLDEIAKKRAS